MRDFLEGSELGVRHFLYGQTFHLYEPGGAAHGSQRYDEWGIWETFLEHSAYDVVVAYVAEIHYDLGHIVERSLSLREQSFYILPHTLSLANDVSYMDHFATVVDACRAADNG